MTDSPEDPSPPHPLPARFRNATTIAGIVILLLIAFLWFQSYFTGSQWYQSTWKRTETGVTERANWLMSNYGSFGIAWRRQQGTMRESLPENDRKFSRFAASRSALSHIHTEGVASWHWIHRSSAPPAMAGSIRHFYGDVFIPYWIPFLLVLVLMVSVNARLDDREHGISLTSESDHADPGQSANRKPRDDTIHPQHSGNS